MGLSKKLVIQGVEISGSSRAFVIAEAGVNHNGDMKLALRLVEEAKRAGADCVKFQTFSTRHCESKYSLKPDYFGGRDGGASKEDFSRALEFGKAQFRELKAYCDGLGIIFLSMAADLPSLELLADIGSPALKIGSSDTLNFPLFKAIGATGLPVIYSTGISTLEEVRSGVEYLSASGVRELAVLQCTSQYPAPYNEVNLKVIETYRAEFGVPVGLSDHSEGQHVVYAAIGMGAKIIEKHFTLDRTLPGVDQPASMEPAEFAVMVKRIREVESALGSGQKTVGGSEREHLLTMRKSLFTLAPVRKGEEFTLRNIGAKRPGGGISPIEIDKILGRRAAVDMGEDEFLTWEAVE